MKFWKWVEHSWAFIILRHANQIFYQTNGMNAKSGNEKKKKLFQKLHVVNKKITSTFLFLFFHNNVYIFLLSTTLVIAFTAFQYFHALAFFYFIFFMFFLLFFLQEKICLIYYHCQWGSSYYLRNQNTFSIPAKVKP